MTVYYYRPNGMGALIIFPLFALVGLFLNDFFGKPYLCLMFIIAWVVVGYVIFKYSYFKIENGNLIYCNVFKKYIYNVLNIKNIEERISWTRFGKTDMIGIYMTDKTLWLSLALYDRKNIKKLVEKLLEINSSIIVDNKFKNGDKNGDSDLISTTIGR